MHVNRQGAETPAPQTFMPSAWDAIASRMVGRTAGITLLIGVLGLWLALMSWVITDPSFTNFTGTSARNWMGAPGAILSDLMLQTLGLAAVVALLAPMLWALELIATEKIEGLRSKLMLFPVALLLIAGAFSSIPAGESWPLYNGLGGILGDLMCKLVAGVLGLVKSNHEGLAAGILLATFGLPALGHTTGLAMHDFGDLFHSAKTDGHAEGTSWFEELNAKAPHGRPEAPHASQPAIAPQPLTKGPSWPGGRTEPSFGDTPDIQTPRASGPPAPWSDRPAAMSDEDDQPLDLIDADQPTEPSSRAMARRFAPRNGAGAAETLDQATLDDEPAAAAPPAASAPPAETKPALMRGLKFNGGGAPYQHPSLNLLKRPAGPKAGLEHSQAALRGSARLLEEVLADFSVKGEVKDIRPGPVVTLFELEPARGTKSSRVVALADDIARSMSATSVRVAVVPGRNAIGIELPNVRREGVLLREIFESDAFKTTTATLPIALGKSIGGEPVVADLARMPHLLVAGTTGSGKSVGVNAMILSLLYRLTPDECRFIMIDPKMLELSVYNGIPHLLAPVVTDPHKAINALNWVVGEMEERYKRMSKLSVRNIDVFNNRVRNAKKRGEAMARRVQTGFDRRTGAAIYEQEDLNLEPMPYIVVVVDEFADLMVVAGKEIEGAVQRLAQMARAAGIHLIMATQRPSVDIITGTIKANFPTRVSFKVTSKIDSRTILNEQGAEQLLGQGDMLYSSGSGGIVRVHGAFVADDEVESIAAALRKQGKPSYVDDILDGPDGDRDGDGSETRAESGDDLFDKAVAIVLRDQKASTSYIQRRLSIGYNKAASLIERMEEEGLISPANALGKREILSGARRGGRDLDED